MSRVGKHPVIVPKDCSVSLNQGVLSVKGKLGALALSVPQGVEVAINDNLITVKPSSASKQSRALWGTIRARIQGMVVGTTVGFTKTLELVGVGYRAALKGNAIDLQLGFSHPVVFDLPAGVTAKCEKPTSIQLHSYDKQIVGQVAAKIRSLRSPEPYKGKGVRYEGEIVLRKEGKKK
jgi:large subunit ribosomal protein L6